MNTKSLIKILMVAIVAMTFFTSCNSNGKGGKSEDTLGSTTENGDFIDFYNAYVDVNKIEKEKIEDIAEWVTEKYTKDKQNLFVPTYSFRGIDYEKNVKKLNEGLKVKVDQQDEINKNIKILLASAETIRAKMEEFKLYKTAEDFKADNWKKGDELVDSIKVACENYYSASDALSPIMSALADKAEAEFIAKDPNKDYILALKKSMKNLDKFYDALVEASNGKDKTKLDSSYTDIEKSLTDLKALNPENIKDVARKSYYGNYVKYFEETVAVCRKANNNVKSGSANYQSLGNEIDSKYSILISTYNNFIN